MEEQSQNTNEVIEVKDGLTLSNKELAFLKEAAKWANFLAILGFIGIGFMVIFAFFASALFAFLPSSQTIPGFMGGLFTVVYLILAAIYFFPVYYLYGFASRTKKAIIFSDNTAISKAFEFLKSHYKFIGILYIVLMGLYVLGGIFAAIGFMIGMH